MYTYKSYKLKKHVLSFKHILVNIREISVAIVSNIGETRVNVIYPSSKCQNEAPATEDKRPCLVTKFGTIGFLEYSIN